MHERRRFVSKVDFVTSPGFLNGSDSRRQSGLLFGRVSRIVTNLGIMGFDAQMKVVRLESLNPDVSVQEVVENTGFDLLIPDGIPVTEPPQESELDLLRSIDPERKFI
jgi:glutaconate CoA-transferase subunit B